MPEAKANVLAMVRQEIEKNASVKNKALMAEAKRLDRSISRMNPRQFHATYRLRATRDIAAAAKPRKKARKVTAKTRAKAAAKTRTRTAAKAPARNTVTVAARAVAPAVNRDAVRAVLLELATEVAAADKAAVIGVVGSLDRYVDRVVAAC